MRKTAAGVLASLILVFGATGCEQPEIKLIDKVEVAVSPNLEFIDLVVKFDRSIQTAVQGAFNLFEYGSLIVNPWTNTTPFSAGFRMSTAIFNEQELIGIDPVSVLPNGANMPIGINTALVQLSGNTPIDPQFDLYGYVDIAGRQWLGMAVIFSFLNQALPAGAVVGQGFFNDGAGRPGALVSVFGPQVENGRVVRAGGLALFGNVPRLIERARLSSPPRLGNGAKMVEMAPLARLRYADRPR